MRTAKQLSVSLVNKPGRLADMLGALAKGKVNFLALSVMDSRERGTVRFVPDEFSAATEVLEKLNIRFDAADVLLVDVPSQNGAFRNICERLASDHLNIDYAYCSVNPEKGGKGNMLAVIKVNDLNKAQRILQTNGHSRRQQPGRRPVHAR